MLKTDGDLFECQNFVLQLKTVEIEFPVVSVGDPVHSNGNPVLDFLVQAIGALFRAKPIDRSARQSGFSTLSDTFALIRVFIALVLTVRIDNLLYQFINAGGDAFILAAADFLCCKSSAISVRLKKIKSIKLY